MCKVITGAYKHTVHVISYLPQKQGSGDLRDFFAKSKKQIPNKLLEGFVSKRKKTASIRLALTFFVPLARK